MHRTESDGSVGGLHVDQAGGIPGAIIDADTLNACQEEIAHIIERCGGTLNTAAEDDSGTPPTKGRTQLYEAIFQGGHITKEAISTLSFDNFNEGTIGITSGTYTWDQNVASFSMANSDNNSYVEMVNGEVECKYHDVISKLDGRGIQFPNGPGLSAYHNMFLRTEGFQIDAITDWTESGTTGLWTTTAGKFTTLPSSEVEPSGIVDIKVLWISGSSRYLCPAYARFSVNGSWIYINEMKVVGITGGSPPSTVNVLITYDAVNLDLTP